MKAIIVNQHTLNYGDDIAGISLVKELQKTFEDIHIDIIYNTKGNLKNLSNVTHRNDLTLKGIGLLPLLMFIFFSLFGINIPLNGTLRKYKEAVITSDIILVSPCGANIGIYKDWRFLLKLYIVVKFGGRPIFHNNTIGNSSSTIFNLMAKYVLKHSELYVREKASYDFLKENNLFSVRSVDTGFLFENEEVMIKEYDYFLFIPTKLNNWHPHFSNIDEFKFISEYCVDNFVEIALKEDKKIVILPHLYGNLEEKKLLNNYKDIFIKKGMKDSTIVIPKIESAYEYDNYIKNASFVLSMRYHGVVMSIKNSVPFLSLAYENKMKEVCSYTNVDFLNKNLLDIFNEKEQINIGDIYYNQNIPQILAYNNTVIKNRARIAIDQLSFIYK